MGVEELLLKEAGWNTENKPSRVGTCTGCPFQTCTGRGVTSLLMESVIHDVHSERYDGVTCNSLHIALSLQFILSWWSGWSSCLGTIVRIISDNQYVIDIITGTLIKCIGSRGILIEPMSKSIIKQICIGIYLDQMGAYAWRRQASQLMHCFVWRKRQKNYR